MQRESLVDRFSSLTRRYVGYRVDYGPAGTAAFTRMASPFLPSARWQNSQISYLACLTFV